MDRLGTRARLGRLWGDFSMLMAATLLVFLAINAVAHAIFLTLRERREGVSVGRFFISPISPRGMEIIKRVLGVQDEGLLRELLAGDPGIRPHPVLAFTEGFSRPLYRVGVESIRYQSGWTDADVRGWLKADRKHTFLFGGSTTFGHGSRSDETLAAQLSRLGIGLCLNFGVQAYDSIREVDLLLHLLRLGYRPARVIFVDGLNDVTTFAWSPYRDLEKPRTQGLLIDRGQQALIFGYPRANNMLSALTFSLPAVQLWRRLAARSSHPSGVLPKTGWKDPLDWQQLMHFYLHWDRIQAGRSRQLAQELAGYYRKNIDFVQSLGRNFGFQPFFVYQPIGLLEAANPFLKPAFAASDVHTVFETVQQTVRREIAAGRLDMVDCSRSLTPQAADSFVDASHYSRSGNLLLARCIEEALERGPGG